MNITTADIAVSNASFIAAANPETVKKLISLCRDMIELAEVRCYDCGFENEDRDEKCPERCYVGAALKKHGIEIPRNPEMEVFG